MRILVHWFFPSFFPFRKVIDGTVFVYGQIKAFERVFNLGPHKWVKTSLRFAKTCLDSFSCAKEVIRQKECRNYARKYRKTAWNVAFCCGRGFTIVNRSHTKCPLPWFSRSHSRQPPAVSGDIPQICPNHSFFPQILVTNNPTMLKRRSDLHASQLWYAPQASVFSRFSLHGISEFCLNLLYHHWPP